MLNVEHLHYLTETHALLVGGSKLYGLDTPESDTDYRGVYATTDLQVAAGFQDHSSIVKTGEVDATYYELGRFLALLRKTNTQVMEVLFAPDSAFSVMTPEFEWLRSKKYELFDSEKLKQSLLGYIHSEIRLATGERRGQLGSLRKQKIETFGFSPKNFTQLLRLIFVGKYLYEHGEYVVRVADVDPDYHELLMIVKTKPELFTKEDLVRMVESGKSELVKVMESSKLKTEFNTNLASKFLLTERAKLL
jgi:predicted nucleotidyltransferase